MAASRPLNRTTPRVLFALLVVPVVLALAWVSVSAQRASADGPFASVVRQGPWNTPDRLRADANGIGVVLSPQEKDALRNWLWARPADGEAYGFAAMSAAASGDVRRARSLADLSLTLQPRAYGALLWQIGRAEALGDSVTAANGYLRLVATRPADVPGYIPRIAALAQDRRNIPRITATFERFPSWRATLMEALRDKKYDPAIAFAILSGSGATSANAGEQQALIGGLVASGEFDRAYLAWISLLPDTALDKVDIPYDRGFRGLPGGAPFNWSLLSEMADRATIGSGGLEISYSGRKPITLASQVMVLNAGSYRFRSIVDDVRTSDARSHSLAWRLRCLPSNTLLATLDVDLSRAGIARASDAFSVRPRDCGAVLLSLEAQARDIPVRLSARVRGVQLDRLGPPKSAGDTASQDSDRAEGNDSAAGDGGTGESMTGGPE